MSVKTFLRWLWPRHPTFWIFQALIWTFITFGELPAQPTILALSLANVLADRIIYGPEDWR